MPHSEERPEISVTFTGTEVAYVAAALGMTIKVMSGKAQFEPQDFTITEHLRDRAVAAIGDSLFAQELNGSVPPQAFCSTCERRGDDPVTTACTRTDCGLAGRKAA